MVHVIYLLKFFINTEPHVKENENKLFFFYEEILKNLHFDWQTGSLTVAINILLCLNVIFK